MRHAGLIRSLWDEKDFHFAFDLQLDPCQFSGNNRDPAQGVCAGTELAGAGHDGGVDAGVYAGLDEGGQGASGEPAVI